MGYAKILWNIYNTSHRIKTKLAAEYVCDIIQLENETSSISTILIGCIDTDTYRMAYPSRIEDESQMEVFQSTPNMD